MIINPQIPLHRLVLSLSEALDHVCHPMADHQLRVAYIGTRIARAMGFAGQDLRDVFHAGALHDIGLILHQDRVRTLTRSDLSESGSQHALAGYELLRDSEHFASAAPLVRYHHADWQHGGDEATDGDTVPTGSYVLSLADAVSYMIRPDVPILHQVGDIFRQVESERGKRFCPDCVDALFEAGRMPAFWLDAMGRRIYATLIREVDWPTLTIDESAVQGIAQIFGRLVDGLSPWTGTHSAGVAATAAALSKRLKFSRREQNLIRAAGYLHDIGKIAVPTEILDKPGKLTPAEWAVMKTHTYHTFHILESIGGMPQICEWAAFHHERLDGNGYPFGHGASELTLGARIMAVADIATAITEDRPYRKGMSAQKALEILNRAAVDGALDGDVVGVLQRDFVAINDARLSEQSAYAVKQRELIQMMSPPQLQPASAE